MLFQVEVVSQGEYETFIEDLRDSGNTGILGTELDQYELQIDQRDRMSDDEGYIRDGAVDTDDR
ncbi:hypothetical protein [Ornithinimicrobium kibberense]